MIKSMNRSVSEEDSSIEVERDLPRLESSSKPVLKSRLKRLLGRPFPNVLRSSNSDKLLIRDGITGTEFEPSLAKMVQNNMEEINEKQKKNGRNHRLNCFNGNNDSSDDEFDLFDDSLSDAYDHFKEEGVD